MSYKWADLLCDTASRVAPTADKCVGGSYDVPVEESCSPNLARNKRATEDTNEEADEVQTHGVLHGSCKCCGDSAHEEQGSKGLARTNGIAHGARDSSHEQCRCECDDVGVGDLILRQVQILLDTDAELQDVSYVISW